MNETKEAKDKACNEKLMFTNWWRQLKTSPEPIYTSSDDSSKAQVRVRAPIK
jgi:hypothetical protein